MLLIAKRTALDRSPISKKSVSSTRRKTRVLARNIARMKLHLVLARSREERQRKMRAGREKFPVKTP